MIKLLALDLDGTLLDSGGKIPKENIAAIRRAEEIGVLVTIATGRRFRDALPVAIEAGLNAPVVCHNGALIKYADSLEVVSSSIILSKTISEILRVGKEFGGNALVSCNPHSKGLLLYDTISDDNIPLKRYIEWSKRLHGDEAEDAIHHVESLEDAIMDEEVIHISFSGHCAPMARLRAILEDELGPSANILATIYPALDFTLLDILPPDSSKASALKKLADLNRLLPENIMAVGDNHNDLEMLHFAGIPVIMGNAEESLLASGKFYKTLSNNENGVAAAIGKFIIGEFNGK